jgi:hypothetical protein
MKTKLTILFSMLIIFSYAQQQVKLKQAAFAHLGSTGFGVGYQNHFKTKFAVGGSISYMNLSPTLFMKSLSVSRQFRVTSSAKFTDVAAYVKWFPFGKEYFQEWEDNWSYIKVGVLYRAGGNFSIKSDFQPKQAGKSFNEADPIRGNLVVDVQTWKLQPFVNIGHQLFGKNQKIRGHFEWGASLQGSPSSQIQQIVTPGISAVNESKIRSTLNAIKIYPDLNFQIGYWF